LYCDVLYFKKGHIKGCNEGNLDGGTNLRFAENFLPLTVLKLEIMVVGDIIFVSVTNLVLPYITNFIPTALRLNYSFINLMEWG